MGAMYPVRAGGSVNGKDISPSSVTSSGDIRSDTSIIANGGHYVGHAGQYAALTDRLRLPNTGSLIFSDSADCRSSAGSQLVPGGAGQLAQRDGANAQTYILSFDYTDPANFSQLKISTEGGIATISIEESGSGAGKLGSYIYLPQGVLVPYLATGTISFNSAFSSTPNTIWTDGTHLYWNDSIATVHQLDN